MTRGLGPTLHASWPRTEGAKPPRAERVTAQRLQALLHLRLNQRVKGRTAMQAACNLSAFQPRGVPRSTSKLSPRAPAQMGRRETEHEGGRKKAKKGETRGLRVALRQGRVRLQ
jgi:hypothetical protein